MDWLELFKNFSLLFFCFGMVQQKNEELTWKEKFNIAHNLCVIHQRALVVICREQWGKNALGFPCVLAFGLMFFWATFSQDPLMYCWLGLWSLYYVKRRIEALRLAKTGQVHTLYDGWPFDAIRFCGSENIAKRFVEPILIGILGGGLRWFYIEQGWSPAGLPNFLLLGVVTLPLVASVQQAVYERRVEAMRDARLEQESMVRDYRDKYGY